MSKMRDELTAAEAKIRRLTEQLNIARDELANARTALAMVVRERDEALLSTYCAQRAAV